MNEAIVPSHESLLSDPKTLAERASSYFSARDILLKAVKERLTPGVDYQLIHRKLGASGSKSPCPNDKDKTSMTCEACGAKATMSKPGSEKIDGMLQLRPIFLPDWDTWDMLGKQPGVVAYVCFLVHIGKMEALAPIMANISNGSIDVRKAILMLQMSDAVAGEGRGVRSASQDYGDLNKAAKMGQKSAQTDATLRTGGLSELMTQDLEDMAENVKHDLGTGGLERFTPQAPSSQGGGTASPSSSGPTSSQAPVRRKDGWQSLTGQQKARVLEANEILCDALGLRRDKSTSYRAIFAGDRPADAGDKVAEDYYLDKLMEITEHDTVFNIANETGILEFISQVRTAVKILKDWDFDAMVKTRGLNRRGGR